MVNGVLEGKLFADSKIPYSDRLRLESQGEIAISDLPQFEVERIALASGLVPCVDVPVSETK